MVSDRIEVPLTQSRIEPTQTNRVISYKGQVLLITSNLLKVEIEQVEQLFNLNLSTVRSVK